MSENIGRYNVIFEILTKQQGDIDEVKKKATGLQGVFQTAKGAFAGIISANIVQSAISGITGIISKSVGLAAGFETTSQSFKVLLGDFESAKKLIADLNAFSIETPFEPAEIQASAKTLLGFGRSAKETIADIRLIGNASAATGANLQSLATVFGQVAGIGKLGGQDALQFINQGLPVYQLLAESTGKSVSEIKKLQEQGKITFNDLRASFVKASEDGGKFAGALEAQSKTFSGLVSTLKGNIDEVLKSFGEIALPILKPLIKVANDFFNLILNGLSAAKPQIQGFVAGFITFYQSALQPVVDAFRNLVKQIKSGSESSETFRKVLNGITGIMRVVGQVTGFVVDKVADLIGFFKTSDIPFIVKLRAGLGLVLDIFENIGPIIEGTIAAVNQAGQNIFDTFTLSYLEAKKLINDFKAFLGSDDAAAQSIILQGQINRLKKEGKTAGQAFKEAFDNAVKNRIKIGTIEEEKSGSAKTPNENKGGTGGGAGKKDADKEKKAQDEKLKRQDEYFKALFAQQEAAEREDRTRRIAVANETIQGTTKLKEALENIEIDSARRLEIIELNQQRAILAGRQAFFIAQAKSKKKPLPTDSEFVELGNQIDELDRKLDAFTQNSAKFNVGGFGFDAGLAVLNSTIDLQDALLEANEKERVQQEIHAKKSIGNAESLAREIKRINIESEIAKLEILKFFAKEGTKAALDIENAILDLEKELKGITPFKKEGGEEKPGLLQKIFGLNNAEFAAFKKAIDRAVSYAQEAVAGTLQNEIEITEKRISIQEERVEAAEKIAEKGNVKQLQIEEARLAELTEKRQRYVQAQQAISQLEILQAQSVAAANSIAAIAGGFKQGGFAGIATGIATGIALVAQIALITSTIRNSFSDIPSFKDGIPVFSTRKDGRVTGPGNGKSDSVPAMLSNGERVVDAMNNQIIGNIPNAELAEAVQLYKAYPKLKNPIIVAGQNKMDISELKEGMAELQKSFEGLKIVTKLDVDGFSQSIERRVDKVIRRNKIKG